MQSLSHSSLHALSTSRKRKLEACANRRLDLMECMVKFVQQTYGIAQW